MPPQGAQRTAVVYVHVPGKSRGGSMAPVIVAIVALSLVIGVAYWRRDSLRRHTGFAPSGDNQGYQPAASDDDDQEPKWEDPAKVLDEAIAKAKRKNADAKLVLARFWGVQKGQINNTGWQLRAFAKFEYLQSDGSPGGYFDLDLREGRWEEGSESDTVKHLRDAAVKHYPLPSPRCSGPDAWEAARAKGVGKYTHPMLMYELTEPPSGDPRPAWVFRGETGGSPVRVDATTCGVMADDADTGRPAGRPPTAAKPVARPTPSPKPAPSKITVKPPPKPPPKVGCGCPPDDLMCAMKCSAK